MHKDDYKKSNKTAGYNQFLLENEGRKLAIEWFESNLHPNEVYSRNKRNPGDDSDDKAEDHVEDDEDEDDNW